MIIINIFITFKLARKTAGRTGKRVSYLESLEEIERESRVSRMCSRMARNEFEDVQQAKTLDFDLENLARDFPMETLWYSGVSFSS